MPNADSRAALTRDGINVAVTASIAGAADAHCAQAAGADGVGLFRTEALFLDHTYTAKAMAGLIARCRAGQFDPDQTVLFWHTGGQVGFFA